MSKGLATAYAIKRKSMNKGGVAAETPRAGVEDSVVICNPSSIASAIRAKRMSQGGQIEEDTDFLDSDEDDSDQLPAESDEFSPVEDQGSKRKRMLSKAFEAVRKMK